MLLTFVPDLERPFDYQQPCSLPLDQNCVPAESTNEMIYLIDHFTVVGLVTWPLNGCEAGVDLVLIKTSLLLLCKSSCSYAN